ncbi:cytosolic sulfotransferase 16-like [Rutidosis leptorrhynchoides]|uniref:cytosolic sulfotransferase 16-like n=1 Tax=Rutidosis leptorrhynchoides TaxID=125765 RepID=UPI003A993916
MSTFDRYKDIDKDDDQKSTYKKHAQLITELPKTIGWSTEELFLYQGYWLPEDALLGVMFLQHHFKPRSTDFILSSFMKSGTTWLRSLMFSIQNRSTFDFNDHPLLQKGPHEIFPSLDFPTTTNKVQDCSNNSLRLFATHYAHSLLPSSITNPSSGCKLVYVCRDPKDVMGVLTYGPYWDHVLGFWKASLDSPNNIFFLKYEGIKREPEVIVKRLGEFMGVPFSVDEEENGMIEKIVKFCSFEHLKNLEVNKNGSYLAGLGYEMWNKSYFRRGEIGDWKNHLTPEMQQRIDGIIKEKFKGSGFTFI